MPVGRRVANHELPNAHRVRKSSGIVPPGFRWNDPGRTDDPTQMLRAEGVPIDEQGRAAASHRMTAEDLAALIGRDVEDLPGAVPDLGDEGEAERFSEQLYAAQEPAVADAVLRVLDAWRGLGGRLAYGRAEETSVFLMLDRPAQQVIWPAVVYPSGKVEVVFQHLQYRPPFNDVAVRDDLRRRLNAVPGVDLPEAKLALRPGFDASLLVDPEAQELLLEALAWFRHAALAADAAA